MKVNKQTNKQQYDFSPLCFFQMFCWRRAIVRLVVFVWLFSAVSFQMFPQITCLRIYKITLVAFVDTVCFQMCIRLIYWSALQPITRRKSNIPDRYILLTEWINQQFSLTTCFGTSWMCQDDKFLVLVNWIHGNHSKTPKISTHHPK